jgi:glycosyltransferase involved in cell wall biosynthesis
MNDIFISIIIPTIGKDDCLKQLLLSIRNIQPRNIEIIAVDQNKDGLIDGIIAEFAGVLPVKHCKVDFTGLSRARNYGVGLAQGAYIIFPDDDCEFLADSFNVMYAELSQNNPDVLCGKVVDRNFKDSVVRFAAQPGWLGLKKYTGMTIEACMIFKSEIIKQHPFDEHLGAGCFYGSQEGFDLVLRLLHNNVSMYYTPKLMLYHPNKISSHSTPAEIKRSFYYSSGFAYLCKKHSLWKHYYSRLIKVLLYIPFCAVIKRKNLRYYLAELSGLIAGRVL